MTNSAVMDGLTLSSFGSVGDVFAVVGETMRVHKGRSVVQLQLEGGTHFLKRFWLVPSQLFKGHVRRGFHELRMIDWLNANGFAGPRVVKRGWSGKPPLCRRMYFLMEEVAGELPLDAAWSRFVDERKTILESLASFAARLHDAGFVHTDFSERHILVGKTAGEWTFRLIDVERASIDRATNQRVADDLATLAASVMDEALRNALRTVFLDDYATHRTSWPAGFPVRALAATGKPTKAFF